MTRRPTLRAARVILPVLCICTAYPAPADAPPPHEGWLTHQSDHFTFYYAPDSALAAPGVIQQFAASREQALEAICAHVRVEPRGTIFFYAYDSDDVARRLIGQGLGFAIPHANTIHSRINQTPGHEVAHVVDYWFDERRLPTVALREGFAVFLDQSGRDWLAIGRDLLLRGELPSITELMTLTARGEGYDAAGSLVSYLCQAQGLNRFRRLWGVDTADFERGVRSVYGWTVEELEANWREFLRGYRDEIPPAVVTPELRAAAAADARAEVDNRFTRDQHRYSVAQLQEIEALYSDASGGMEARRERLQRLVREYPDSNRAGCAVFYLGQTSRGREQVETLQRAIRDHDDCLYGDGVQVGPLARYLLGEVLRGTGRHYEARRLFDEIREHYPRALTRPGQDGQPRLLVEIIR